jgi:hypothetical protein
VVARGDLSDPASGSRRSRGCRPLVLLVQQRLFVVEIEADRDIAASRWRIIFPRFSAESIIVLLAPTNLTHIDTRLVPQERDGRRLRCDRVVPQRPCTKRRPATAWFGVQRKGGKIQIA